MDRVSMGALGSKLRENVEALERYDVLKEFQSRFGQPRPQQRATVPDSCRVDIITPSQYQRYFERQLADIGLDNWEVSCCLVEPGEIETTIAVPVKVNR